MKVYMLDEVYEIAKKLGYDKRIQDLAKDRYKTNSIREELNSYHDILNSEEFKNLMSELKNEVAKEDIGLYGLMNYNNIDSYDVTMSRLNTVKSMRDRFVLLDKVISYKMAEATEYELLVSSFCRMYEEVSEDIRSTLPKYIHLAYFKWVNIRYCMNISTAGNVDIFAEYEKYMDTIHRKVYNYIKSKDTIENLRLELRCVGLQYILPRLSDEDKVKCLQKVAKLVDMDNLDFDNKYRSIGVIWTYDRLFETYFDMANYVEFFRWVYYQYMYIDNAMNDKERLFDSLRYYNMNHMTSFIIAMRRFYYIQNLYPEFSMEFQNVPQSDEKFILDPALDYTMYDSYANKLIMEKYKHYVDTWYELNKHKLEDLALNKAEILNCRKIIIDKVSEAEITHVPTRDSDYVPVIPDLPDGYTVNIPTEKKEEESTEKEPVIDIIPKDIAVDEPTTKPKEEVVVPPIPTTPEVPTDDNPKPDNTSVLVPPLPPIPNTPSDTGNSIPSTPSEPVTPEPADPVSPTIPPVPDAGNVELPSLPPNFSVDEDMLSGLTAEELAALNNAEME